MCGIAGIVGKLDASNHAALARMSDAMAHRGPDAQGKWQSEVDARGWGAMFAHRRLAILDLSPAGAQPMVDQVTGHTIVFNGEVYNYQELRERLALEGQTFESSGDTAVMLRALGLYGSKAVAWFRGMFAFASWDRARRVLLLVRDPLGIKPLYVARNQDRDGDWAVLFASEIRALLASGLLGAARIDPRAVSSVVWNGFVVGPETMVSGVELLPPGWILELNGDGAEVSSREHWAATSAPPPDRILTERELEHILEEDVRLHLLSDVPLGVFLSGGIDSSAVANLAQRSSRAPIHTFTLAFEGSELNEGPIARRVAAAIGTEHREVVLTESHVVEQLETALDSLDQPTFDGLNSYYMSRAIRAAGFTVALVGTGGDELFGGYSSFRDLPVLQRWARRSGWFPRTALAWLASFALASRRRGQVDPQTRWAKLPDMIRRGDDLTALYQLAHALFLPEFNTELLAGDVAGALVDGLTEKMRERLARETRSRSALSAVSIMELRMFLGERLLRDNDSVSMAASIEQRLPLVDRVLFESVDLLPETTRYSPVGRKAVLRRLGLQGLPPELFERPKRGFELPFDGWIRRGLKKAMDEALLDPGAVRAVGLRPEAVERLWRAFLDGAPGLYWSRVWAIYVLVRWCHRHRVFR